MLIDLLLSLIIYLFTYNLLQNVLVSFACYFPIEINTIKPLSASAIIYTLGRSKVNNWGANIHICVNTP